MALPVSGSISLSAVQTELGGTNPVSISEYYGVGTLPASGVIALTDFYGQSLGAASVVLPTLLNDQNETTGTVRASLNFESDGDIIRGTYSNKTWWSAAPSVGIGASYQLQILNASGTTVTGITVNTWTALTTGLELYIETTGPSQSLTSQFELQIRDTATSTVQASTNCTLFASNNLL